MIPNFLIVSICIALLYALFKGVVFLIAKIFKLEIQPTTGVRNRRDEHELDPSNDSEFMEAHYWGNNGPMGTSIARIPSPGMTGDDW